MPSYRRLHPVTEPVVQSVAALLTAHGHIGSVQHRGKHGVVYTYPYLRINTPRKGIARRAAQLLKRRVTTFRNPHRPQAPPYYIVQVFGTVAAQWVTRLTPYLPSPPNPPSF